MLHICNDGQQCQYWLANGRTVRNLFILCKTLYFIIHIFNPKTITNRDEKKSICIFDKSHAPEKNTCRFIGEQFKYIRLKKKCMTWLPKIFVVCNGGTRRMSSVTGGTRHLGNQPVGNHTRLDPRYITVHHLPSNLMLRFKRQ